ncbi:MAG: DegT/DnrJ/EryC1/StrS family aminotransferase [Actinomycetaceae bacterium]|nr:DegT/DnrJ/EryC1/StrS family aminotransferase [Actinomycetaceae bacterium]MDY6083085.1 DegT/DnrJ/EryC1/StrS family aminotransferase [Actinomycetaceae bacterium]
MRKRSALAALCEQMAAYTGTRAHDWYPVFKARYGMCAVWEAVARVRGKGSILTQLFTCSTAVDPIPMAGLTPIYSDVDLDTLSISPQLTVNGEPVRQSVHGVVLQHTFGVFDNRHDEDLASNAHDLGAIVMEDNAHALGRLARGSDGEPIADISVHSFGVQKILTSTRFGGAIWVNPRLASTDPDVDRQIRLSLSSLHKPAMRTALSARAYLTQIRVFSKLPSRLDQGVRHALQKVRLFEPAVTPAEQKGRLEYPNLAMTPWVAATALTHLRSLASNLAHRRDIVRIYREEFADAEGITVPAAVDTGEPQPLLLFPILLADDAHTDAARQASRSQHVRAVRWYNTILFPGSLDDASYSIPPDRGVAQELTHRSLGLPTDVDSAAARAAARSVRAAIAEDSSENPVC